MPSKVDREDRADSLPVVKEAAASFSPRYFNALAFEDGENRLPSTGSS
jgi:hypothetical protein